MRCSKCGADISKDAKFCSYCGNKVEVPSKQPNEETPEIPPIPSDKPAGVTQKKEKAPKSLTDKAKRSASAHWGKLSAYGKAATVAIAAFVFLGLVALLAGKIVAAVIAVVQIVLAIVSVLMDKGVIKLERKQLWLKWLIFVIAILATILNIMSYSWGQKNPGNADPLDKPTVSDTPKASAAVITTAMAPYSAAECVGQEYSTIKSEFSSAGFSSIDIEPIEDLKIGDADRVNAVESISVGGNTDFSKEQEFDKSDKVIIRYHVYEKCNVTIHVEFVPNLIFSKYDVNLLLNGVITFEEKARKKVGSVVK